MNKSFIYILNKRGPKTDRCGTPKIRGGQLFSPWGHLRDRKDCGGLVQKAELNFTWYYMHFIMFCFNKLVRVYSMGKAGKYSGPQHQWSQKFFWTPRKERGRKGKTTRRKERRGRKRKNEGRREKEGKEGKNMKEDVKTKPKIKSSKRKKRNEDW